MKPSPISFSYSSEGVKMTPGLKHGWNEIMNIMAMKVSRNLIAPIQAAPFKCIMADETTDAANKEQVVVCL